MTRAGVLALSLVLALPACKKPAGNEDSAWQVSIRGYGPIRTGMTLSDAAAAAARPLTEINPGFEECDYVHFADDSSRSVQFMVVGGRIARVDIDDSTISTNHGIRIGDSEARVQSQYPGRVAVSPHKYVDGHYLTIAPELPADSGLAIVFETDGSTVTTYRSGRVPEVEYIEGCS